MKFGSIRIFAVATMALCGGCAVQNAYLNSQTKAMELAAADVTPHALTIDSSSPWVVNTGRAYPWLDVSYDADRTELLWVRAQGVNESLYARLDSVEIVSADALTLKILVTQAAMAVSLDVTPAAPEPFGPRDATVRTLTVATDLTSWEHLALGGEWLTVTRANGSNELTLSAKGFNGIDDRRDTVVVRPINEALWAYADSIPVVQRGLDLTMIAPEMDEESFDVAIPAAGGTVAASVYSRAAWTLSTDGDTGSGRVALNTTQGAADIENGTQLEITVAANTSADEYEFTLTFTSGDQTYNYICRQAAAQ